MEAIFSYLYLCMYMDDQYTRNLKCIIKALVSRLESFLPSLDTLPRKMRIRLTGCSKLKVVYEIGPRTNISV
jgi:hypothetical protein